MSAQIGETVELPQAEGRLPAYPEWVREVDARLPVSPQVVLSGNVNDVHAVPGKRGTALRSTQDVVRDCLVANGYQAVLHWHVVTGAAVLHQQQLGLGNDLLGEHPAGGGRPAATALGELVNRVVNADSLRVGLVVEGAHRIVTDPDDPALHRLHVASAHLARTAPRRLIAEDRRAGLYNTVVWVVDRENDLPHWLVSAAGVRVVSVPMPTIGIRQQVSEVLLPGLPGYAALDSAARAMAARTMASATEGMPLSALREIVPLAVDQEIAATETENAVRFFRSGLQESPWNEPEVIEKIRNAPEMLNREVLGQERAVRTVVDILSRAALGLSGVHSEGHPSRPQGVVFLAGPTGVGKTELAKQVAELVFGRKEAMVRFDMSEFAAEHTEARLLGAPPGYVGHEAGGELTNAVRQRPFCLLLFDEIEKAHPRILDKFLQILEDGRLTDGSGSTVHFGETLIVFTSNLGIYELDDKGQRVAIVEPHTDYDEVERKVKVAIRVAFTDRIGRPELLNRIGDNIVVFDFIREDVARRLLRRTLNRVAAQVQRRRGTEIRFSDEVIAQLESIVIEPERLAFGGRAVGSVVESHVVNPLARELLTSDRSGAFLVMRHGEDAWGHHLAVKRI